MLDVSQIPSSITAHPPGYIDRENEVIVGLQTDAPLKRAIMPNGGLRMVLSGGSSVPRSLIEGFQSRHGATLSGGSGPPGRDEAESEQARSAGDGRRGCRRPGWPFIETLLTPQRRTLAIVLFAVTAVGVLAAPLVILVFAPGFLDDAGRFPVAVRMLRLTFPYVLFVSLTALAGSVLNAHRRFAVAAFTPVLLNVVVILFAGWIEPLSPWPGAGLAGGVFVAGVAQLAFQLPFLKRLGLLPRPRWDFAHDGVRRIFRLMLPAMFGSSVAQVSILLDTLIASFLLPTPQTEEPTTPAPIGPDAD